MSPWTCMFLVSLAGSMGGVINALLTDNRFILPRREGNVLCPGFLSNVIVGAAAAFISWALYGSGAAIDLAASSSTPRVAISLRLSALAGAFLVGVTGAKWLTNEADKKLLKEGVRRAAGRAPLPPEDCDRLVQVSARQIVQVLESVPAEASGTPQPA
jgi:hypothetical protein